MNIAVIGSRNYPDMHRVWQFVDTLPPDTVVVSGGARGVDSVAEARAIRRGLPKPIVHRPDWPRYGRRAGLIRNPAIVRDADIIVAFWDGLSRGTQDAIIIARGLRKPVYLL